MKRCAYCRTENRAEAIFCTHCRRPLQPTGTPKDQGSRNILLWILGMFLLIGLSAFLFSSRSFLTPTATHTSNGMAAGPAPTRTQKPVAINTCVWDSTRIRRHPSTGSETIGGLVSGTCLMILGRNEDAGWVYMVSEDGQTGWVDASLFSDSGDISRVSVRDGSALANAGRPTLTSAEIAHGAQAYLTEVAATNIPQSPLSQYVTPCFETANRIGDNVSCRMGRAHCDYLPALEGSPTFCSDRPYPDHAFVLVILGQDWSSYDGQCLIVSGYLEVARGALQIEALNRDQVSACN